MDEWKTPVIRLRTTTAGTDQYEEPLPGVVERVELPPALFAPTGSFEPVQPGVASVVGAPSVYWPGQWPDVKATDQLEVSGVVWNVEGNPSPWPLGLTVMLKGTQSHDD